VFRCKVCEEKDKRVADLAEQVGYLRTLLSPPRAKTNLEVHQEANAILNGVNEQILADVPTDPAVLAEREALLSGTY